MKYLALKIFLSFIVILLATTKAHASVIFQDNFDTESVGSFPSKWELVNSYCNSNWFVNSNKEVEIDINNEPCITNIIPNNIEWPKLYKNYSVEFDIKLISGSDHNFVFRYNPLTNNINEIHFQLPGDFGMNLPVDHYVVMNPGFYTNGNKYHVKVVVNNLDVQVYINNQLVQEAILLYELPPGKIALREGTGGDPSAMTSFDNIVVSSIDDDQNINVSLDVPLLKQTSDPWGKEEYDSAVHWGDGSKSIADWGCALTSAAMVFKYHGINKLPNGDPLDPGTLNRWLKHEKDGYIGDGLVNWLALSRLSKQAVAINGITSFDALEYELVQNENSTQLISDLENGNPDILEEGTSNGQSKHFVVGKGVQGNIFLINDPFYARNTLAEGYNNQFSTLGRYIPSQTDLSYILLTASPNVQIELKDEQGNILAHSFVQDRQENDTVGGSGKASKLSMLYYKKPVSGRYFIGFVNFSGKEYVYSAYLYDQNGEVKVLKDTIQSGRNTSFYLFFDGKNSTFDTLRKPSLFSSIFTDLDRFNADGNIANGAYQSIAAILTSAEKDYFSGKQTVSKNKVTSVSHLVEVNQGTHILNSAVPQLYDDLQYIINHL